MNQSTPLQNFRQAVYGCCTGARDALFELSDALLTAGHLGSFAELSLSPLFRRQWPSLYEALQDGRFDRARFVRVAAALVPTTDRVVLAGDATTWPRTTAPTLRDRAVQHHPTAVPGARPITVGHQFSTLWWVPEAQGSWALPFRHERVPSAQTANQVGAQQLRQVVAALSTRPVSVWDSAYGCEPFLTATADIPADKIIRLRSNLSLRRAPGPYSGRGRPRTHGATFNLAHPETWGAPDETAEVCYAGVGPATVAVWRQVHLRTAPKCSLDVAQVVPVRPPRSARQRRALWLAWVGPGPAPPGGTWVCWYPWRFHGEHWYRLGKHTLQWTLPHLRTPAQEAVGSALVAVVTWELWLARALVADQPRPWQKAQAPAGASSSAHLTPGRVRASMGALLAEIGTPAQVPKPRGKSPGWPRGRVRTTPRQYAIIVKHPQSRAPPAA